MNKLLPTVNGKYVATYLYHFNNNYCMSYQLLNLQKAGFDCVLIHAK